VNAQAVYPDGEVVESHGAGVLEKVRPLDGSTFMAAGRVHVLAAGGGFIVEPDSGVRRNQDAFAPP
jgi:hypothetical protein